MASELREALASERQIRSVAKALTILNILAGNGREMSLAEICRESGQAKGTAHGLLATLKDFGYVEQDSFEGKYRLGVRLFEIGSIVANSWDVRRVAAPYIERLVEEFEETVHLAVLNEDQVLYIDKRESRRSIRIVSQIGIRLPAHCSGVGKALLAHLSPTELNRVIASHGLPSYTKNTITDRHRLQDELEKIRQRGYSVDDEEIMEGLRCVAAPIKDNTGSVCAAISVSGPTARLSGDMFDLAVKLVLDTASEISANLGYQRSGNGELYGSERVPL
jgi:DNA-binding IclR family transcriptional regulator